jgi:hypothetical protein
MSDLTDLERRLIVLETKLAALEADRRQEADGASGEKPPAWKRLFTIDGVKSALYVVGIPVLVVGAYDQFSREIWNRSAIAQAEARDAAVGKLEELQAINAEFYTLQARGEDAVAFAQLEATRGRIHRLTDEIHALWSGQPDSFGRFETYTLAEALMAKGDTEAAYDVAATVDPAGIGTIGRADHALLLARIRFAEGDGYDLEAAREHIREAGRIAGTLPDPGQRKTLEEKILAVRTINELWRVGCDPAAGMAEGLAALVEATANVAGTDPVRSNTLNVIAAVESLCTDAG